MPTGNQFTSGQAPSNAVQIFAPDIAAQQTQLARQQRMADILREQSLTPLGNTEVVNGWAVKKSPLEGLAKMAQALMAGNAQTQVDDKQLALSKALQQRLTPDAASKALQQGAAAQPSIPDETGAMVNQGGVGPTVQNAARMDAITSAPPGQADRFSTQNMMEGLRVGMVGGEDAAKAYWADKAATESEKNDRYLGVNVDLARALDIAKRRKDGTMSLQPGQTNVMPDGSRFVAPNFETGVAGGFDTQGNPVASEVQGSSAIASNRAREIAGATSGANAENEIVTVNVGGRNYTMTKAQATRMANGGQPTPEPIAPPTSSAPPPQAGSGQPPAPATVSPSPAGNVDLNRMSQQTRDKVMAGARAQFGLQPGSAPGTSVQSAPQRPQAVGVPGIPGSTPAEDAQRLADVKLKNDPALASANDVATGDAHNFSAYKDTLNKGVDSGFAQYQRNQQVRQLLTEYKTGLAAPEARSAFASSLKNAFPGNQTVRAFAERIDGGDVGSGQELANLLSAAGLTNVIRTLDGNGRVNKAEYEALQAHAETNQSDPDALLGIMDFQDHVYKQQLAEQQALAATEKAKKLNPATWNADYA